MFGYAETIVSNYYREIPSLLKKVNHDASAFRKFINTSKSKALLQLSLMVNYSIFLTGWFGYGVRDDLVIRFFRIGR